MISSSKFWLSSLETAIKTAAAAALGVIGADQLLTALSVDWATVGGVALLAAVVSLLTSVAVPSPEIRAVRSAEKAKAATAAKTAAKRKATAAKK